MISETIGRFFTFIGDVRTELKKSAWPTRSELFESTVMVIISVILLGVFVGVSDLALSESITGLISWLGGQS